MTPAPTQSNIMTALRSFLRAVLPSTGPDGRPVDVIQAQQNEIPEPRGTTYCIMTQLRQERLSTNVDTYEDSRFTGSIAGTTMTISAVDPALSGPIKVGSTMQGVGLAVDTRVTAFGTGSGGIGTYTITPAQTVGSRTLSAGSELIRQAMKVAVQIDFHGDPAADLSGDMAAVVSTLLRDDFGVQQFANQSPNYDVAPLYASDPAQRPFFNDQQQVETRWVVEALLQANVVVSVPQQFADSVDLDVISVEATYAP